MHRRRYGVIRRIYRDAAIWRSERFHKPHLLPDGPFADWEVDPDLRRRAGFYQRLAPW
jgi:hypothetical protein